jgi:hypothetical protein
LAFLAARLAVSAIPSVAAACWSTEFATSSAMPAMLAMVVPVPSMPSTARLVAS